MYKGSNCDRKSQFSEILTEPLNPRVIEFFDQKGKSIETQILLRMVLCLKNIKNYVSWVIKFKDFEFFVWLNLLFDL